jgi:ribosomal protein L11 methyltransferase
MNSWIELSINLPSEGADSIQLFLEPLASNGCFSLNNPSSPEKSRICAYFSNMSDAEKAREQIYRQLKDTRKKSTYLFTYRTRLKKIEKPDYFFNWQKYFKPINIGKKITICPTWIEHEPPKGRTLLKIDPGMAFGTGLSFTTRYCLDQICRIATDKTNDFLDLGCGTGILSAAAKILGIQTVTAVDNDPEAIEATWKNLKLNDLEYGCSVIHSNIEELTLNKQFSLVAANLQLGIIKQNKAQIDKLVQINGCLLVSGVLWAQRDKLLDLYKEWTLINIKHGRKKEWAGFCFRKNPAEKQI